MFRKAEKRKSKLRMGLFGPSGSGKTYSSLIIASGMGGKIALVDTERGSGDLYGNKFDYDILQINAPFHPSKYIQAIHDGEQAGYDVLIVDSLSHAWSGDGGLLDLKELEAARLKNSYTAWRRITPLHNKLIDSILQSGIHIIATARTKTEYILAEDSKGKLAPQKVGMAPIFRDGLEYEFTTVFDLSVDSNVAHASKDRTDLFRDRTFTLTRETGVELISWLNDGKDVPGAEYIDNNGVVHESERSLLDSVREDFAACESISDLQLKARPLKQLKELRQEALDFYEMQKEKLSTPKGESDV